VRLFETIHIDNIKILKALICGKEDPLPLFDGSTKQRVNLLTSYIYMYIYFQLKLIFMKRLAYSDC
jgi:hypothetical protein